MELSYLSHFLITLAAGLTGLGFVLTTVIERLFTDGDVQREFREVLSGMKARMSAQKPEWESEWAPPLAPHHLHPLDAHLEKTGAQSSKTASSWNEEWWTH